MASAAPQLNAIRPPSALLALTELPRAIAEFGSLPWATPLLASAPRGDGHPVLVLPGFTTSDRSTTVLRRYLTRMGYDAHSWDLGRNLGPRRSGARARSWSRGWMPCTSSPAGKSASSAGASAA